MTVEIIISKERLVGVVYEYENGFIGAESRSSMKFKTFKQALMWIAIVCKERTFNPNNDIYKMMPKKVKTEVQNQLNKL